MKSFKETLLEGVFDSKRLKELRELYTNFNKVEMAILTIANSTNSSGGINGGRSISGYHDMVHATKQFTDGNAITKKNEERIKKINKLAEEILSIDEDMKQDLNDFFDAKFPEEMKKLG